MISVIRWRISSFYNCSAFLYWISVSVVKFDAFCRYVLHLRNMLAVGGTRAHFVSTENAHFMLSMLVYTFALVLLPNFSAADFLGRLPASGIA